MIILYLPKSEATKASNFSDVWIFCLAKRFSQIFAKVAVCLAKFLFSWLASSVSGGTDNQNLIFGYIHKIRQKNGLS